MVIPNVQTNRRVLTHIIDVRFIAAEQPPHLACMAPWEGLGDYYRESICRGGIPDHAFWDVLLGWSCGLSSTRCFPPNSKY